VGSANAPYFNSLIAGGSNFSSFYAITHPSQPNYIHLFAGTNHNVVDNGVPATLPFTAPNLGRAVIDTGRTFMGYSEDLPYVGSNVATSGAYARKHNPWVNWQSEAPGPTQLLAEANQPFTRFLSDFEAGTLPTLSIVVPNLDNDMHDGTVAQGDAWLEANIKPYADWAIKNNSLLIVTFDEDEGSSRNRIPTVFYGAGVRPGTVATTWTLHHLLRTIGDMYGAAPSGVAIKTRPIVGCFTSDPPTATRLFRQGLNGYTGAHDTYIESANPGTTRGGATPIVADSSPLSQVLVRFDDVFGAGPTKVPVGARVLSAKLLLLTGPSSGSGDSSGSVMNLHRMLTAWSEASTWSGLGAGVSADGVEASAGFDFLLVPNVLNAWAIFDVSETVQAWADGSAANYGWAVLPGGSDGWRLVSSEGGSVADRPTLEVTYQLCDGDADGDYTVGFADITSVLANWDVSYAPGSGGPGDADFSGQVSFADVTRVLARWGAACP
jgi:acid phosphatase